MFCQPDVAEVSEKETQRHQCHTDTSDDKVHSQMFGFRYQHGGKEYGGQTQSSIVKTFEDEVHNVSDPFPKINTIDIEDVAHSRLNGMQDTFRQMSEFFHYALVLRVVFSGIGFLFSQPAEHIFHRHGCSLGIGICGILYGITDLWK